MRIQLVFWLLVCLFVCLSVLMGEGVPNVSNSKEGDGEARGEKGELEERPQELDEAAGGGAR